MRKIIDIEPEYVEINGIERPVKTLKRKRVQESSIDSIDSLIDQGHHIVEHWDKLAIGYVGNLVMDVLKRKKS